MCATVPHLCSSAVNRRAMDILTRTDQGKAQAPSQLWAASDRNRFSASLANSRVSCAAGISRASEADCPDHREVKSVTPFASEAAFSGARAPAARGNAGASRRAVPRRASGGWS